MYGPSGEDSEPIWKKIQEELFTNISGFKYSYPILIIPTQLYMVSSIVTCY